MIKTWLSTGVGQCDTQTAYIATIADSAISGSSQYNGWYAYSRSRLNTVASGSWQGSWASLYNSVGQYLQADLGTVRRVEKVATQGRQNSNQYVTSFRFSYSVTGSDYTFILNDDGSERIFSGNSDQNTIVENAFDSALVARYVRLYPQTWYGHMSMRWEVYGCEIGDVMFYLTITSSSNNSLD